MSEDYIDIRNQRILGFYVSYLPLLFPKIATFLHSSWMLIVWTNNPLIVVENRY